MNWPRSETEEENRPLNMTYESYFNLIEYKELKEGREASKTAMSRSTIAIWLSIASMAIGTVLSLIQINTPATIDEASLHYLNALKYNDTEIKSSITLLNSAQQNTLNELIKINNSVKDTKYHNSELLESAVKSINSNNNETIKTLSKNKVQPKNANKLIQKDF